MLRFFHFCLFGSFVRLGNFQSNVEISRQFDFTEKIKIWLQYLDSDLLLSKGFFEIAPRSFVTSVSCLDPGLLDSLISKLGILSLWKAFHKLKFDWIKIVSTWLYYLDSEALLEKGFLGTVSSFVLSSSLANSSIIISDNRLPSSLLRSSNFGLSLLWWENYVKLF